MKLATASKYLVCWKCGSLFDHETGVPVAMEPLKQEDRDYACYCKGCVCLDGRGPDEIVWPKG